MSKRHLFIPLSIRLPKEMVEHIDALYRADMLSARKTDSYYDPTLGGRSAIIRRLITVGLKHSKPIPPRGRKQR